eukprot:5696813-Amphidinium_carterae.1
MGASPSSEGSRMTENLILRPIATASSLATAGADGVGGAKGSMSGSAILASNPKCQPHLCHLNCGELAFLRGFS